MYELTHDQLLTVSELVSDSQITYSHLPDDLIDHICCDIESEMSVGLSFNKALERVQCKFGDSGLQKIQEDTILLIDQKYRFMKTTMKIFGNVSLALVGIGTIFKIFHWPGASIGLTLGFVLLALIFYPATILATYRKNGRKNLIIHLMAIIGGMAVILGILFKFQHWPGGGMMLSGGWITLILIFLPVWIIMYSIQNKGRQETRIYAIGVIGLIIFKLGTLFKFQHWPDASVLLLVGAVIIGTIFLPIYARYLFGKHQHVNIRFIYLVIIIAFFLLFGTLTNLNLSKNLFESVSKTDYYARVESGYYEAENQRILENKLFSDAEISNKAEIISARADSLCNFIYNIKGELLLKSKGVDKPYLHKYIENIHLIPEKSNWKVVDQIFFDEGGDGFASLLKNGLKNYEQLILDEIESDPQHVKKLNDLFVLDDISSYGFYETWEYRMFKRNLMYLSITQLTNIERDIRLAENFMYSYYMNLLETEKAGL